MKNSIRLVILSATTAVLCGCAETPERAPTLPSAPVDAWTQCETPRPMVCTMEYAPVCARLAEDELKTYPSRCNACADVAVSAWRAAPCEES